MGEIGTYKGLPVYEFDTKARAIEGSWVSSILACYWTAQHSATIYYNGAVIGELQDKGNGRYAVVNFDEEMLKPKKPAKREEPKQATPKREESRKTVSTRDPADDSMLLENYFEEARCNIDKILDEYRMADYSETVG